MKEQTEDDKAREYVYNLGNYASEHGFKPDECWELSLATADEKSAIERGYCHTLSTKLIKDGLENLFTLIKAQMHVQKINFGSMPLPEQYILNCMKYIVAFNPARQRTN